MKDSKTTPKKKGATTQMAPQKGQNPPRGSTMEKCKMHQGNLCPVVGKNMNDSCHVLPVCCECKQVKPVFCCCFMCMSCQEKMSLKEMKASDKPACCVHGGKMMAMCGGTESQGPCIEPVCCECRQMKPVSSCCFRCSSCQERMRKSKTMDMTAMLNVLGGTKAAGPCVMPQCCECMEVKPVRCRSFRCEGCLERAGNVAKGSPVLKEDEMRSASLMAKCCDMMKNFPAVHTEDKETMRNLDNVIAMMQNCQQMNVCKDMFGGMGCAPVDFRGMCKEIATKLMSDEVACQMVAELSCDPSCRTPSGVMEKMAEMMTQKNGESRMMMNAMPPMESFMKMAMGSGNNPMPMGMNDNMRGMKEMLGKMQGCDPSMMQMENEIECMIKLCMTCCFGVCCSMGQTLTDVLPTLLTAEKEETSPSATEAMGGLAGCMAILLCCCSTMGSLCREQSMEMAKSEKSMMNCKAMMRCMMSCCACLAMACCDMMKNDATCARDVMAREKDVPRRGCLPPAAELLCCMTACCAMGCSSMIASCLCACPSMMGGQPSSSCMPECAMMACCMMCCSQMMDRMRILINLPMLKDEPAAAECCLRCCCAVGNAVASCCGEMKNMPSSQMKEVVVPLLCCTMSCCGMMGDLEGCPSIMQMVCEDPSCLSLMLCGVVACLSACCEMSCNEQICAASVCEPGLSWARLCCLAGGCFVVDNLRDNVFKYGMTRDDALVNCMMGCLTSCCSLMCAEMDPSKCSMAMEAERCMACCTACCSMLSQRMSPQQEKGKDKAECEKMSQLTVGMSCAMVLCCSLCARVARKQQPLMGPMVDKQMMSMLSCCCSMLCNDSMCKPAAMTGGCMDECMVVCMTSSMMSCCMLPPMDCRMKSSCPEEDLNCMGSCFCLLACCRAMKEAMPCLYLCDPKANSLPEMSRMMTKRTEVAMVICCCSCMALCCGISIMACCMDGCCSMMMPMMMLMMQGGRDCMPTMSVACCMADCCRMMEEAVTCACRCVLSDAEMEQVECLVPMQCAAAVLCGACSALCAMASCCGMDSKCCAMMQMESVQCCCSLSEMVKRMMKAIRCCSGRKGCLVGNGALGCLYRTSALCCSGSMCIASTLCCHSMQMNIMKPQGMMVPKSMDCPEMVDGMMRVNSACMSLCQRMREVALACVDEPDHPMGRDMVEMLGMCCCVGMQCLICCCLCCGSSEGCCNEPMMMMPNKMMMGMRMQSPPMDCQCIEGGMQQALQLCMMMKGAIDETLVMKAVPSMKGIPLSMAACCCGCAAAVCGKMGCLLPMMTCDSMMTMMMGNKENAMMMQNMMGKMKSGMANMLEMCACMEERFCWMLCCEACPDMGVNKRMCAEEGVLSACCQAIAAQCCGMGMMALCNLCCCCDMASMNCQKNQAMMQACRMECPVPPAECVMKAVREMAMCCKGMFDRCMESCCMCNNNMPSCSMCAIALCCVSGTMCAVSCGCSCGVCMVMANRMPGELTSKACLEAASVLRDCCQQVCGMAPMMPEGICEAMMVCVRMADEMCCCAPMGGSRKQGCMSMMALCQRMSMVRCDKEREMAMDLLREANRCGREEMFNGCCFVMKKCKGIASYSGMSDRMMACEEEKEGEASLRKVMGCCGEKMRECCAEGIKRCAKSAPQCDAPCLASCVDALCCIEEQCDSFMVTCNDGKQRMVMPINIPAVPMHMARTVH